MTEDEYIELEERWTREAAEVVAKLDQLRESARVIARQTLSDAPPEVRAKRYTFWGGRARRAMNAASQMRYA